MTKVSNQSKVKYLLEHCLAFVLLNATRNEAANLVVLKLQSPLRRLVDPLIECYICLSIVPLSSNFNSISS